MRASPAESKNKQLGDWSKWVLSNEFDNLKFFSEALKVMDSDYQIGNRGHMAIGLVGSRDIPGVTLRRAQSVLRWDRRPSLWSHAFLIAQPLRRRGNVAKLDILEIPLFPRNGQFPKPESNGLNESTLEVYANPQVDANVALITVAKAQTEGEPVGLSNQEVRAIAERAGQPNADRLRYDLWDCLCAWQQYLWSEGQGPNPLREGVPVPSSAFVEMAYEAIGLDLVPSASERNSAPEHLWNAAVWWHQSSVREKFPDDLPFVLTGCYALRDLGCSLASSDE